jgi:hypothetical protein
MRVCGERRIRAGKGMTRHPKLGAVERRPALSVNLHRIVQLRSASNYGQRFRNPPF